MTAELLKEFAPQIEKITLIPADKGAFEVTVNGDLIYSKFETGRHVEEGEMAGLVRELV